MMRPRDGQTGHSATVQGRAGSPARGAHARGTGGGSPPLRRSDKPDGDIKFSERIVAELVAHSGKVIMQGRQRFYEYGVQRLIPRI